MKKVKVLFLALFMSLAVFSVAAKGSSKQIVTYQSEFKTNSVNKKIAYQLLDNGKIVFVFDSARNGIKLPKRVFVEGSFNGWKKNNPDWELTKVTSKVWTYECDLQDVMVPGNSGFPEFKFYIIADEEYIETVCGKELSRLREIKIEPALENPGAGFQMMNNNLILLPKDDPQYVVENLKTANRLKKLKEFDLENPEDVKTISNFRQVPGTTKLFRGYHPYKASRSELDTEKTRISLVNKQLKENEVNTIITLSGEEKIDPKKEQLSVYVGNIQQNGNQLFVKTHYNTVYYGSNTREFGKMMGEIVRFINNHPGAYYVHCRLGTDRTGVISANLAALCGASWDEIAADYQKTNEMGIREFRDKNLLKYSFENMLGKPLSEVEDLQKEVKDYYVREGFLSAQDVNSLISNLK